MKSERAFFKKLELRLPVIQAPMAGGGDTPELVAAVSNGGGLGFFGAAYLTPEQIIKYGHAIRKLTSEPFGVNLFAPTPAPAYDSDLAGRARNRLEPFYIELGIETVPAISQSSVTFEDQLQACLEVAPQAFSFTFGRLPERALGALKERDIAVFGTATTVDEAQLLEKDGVDAVIAQGSEAGGHRGSFAQSFQEGMVGLFSLVPQVVDSISIPVIASGGVMDGRGIVAAQTLGASAVQMGTAFLVCDEAGAAKAYKASILSASEHHTAITRAFSGRPARGISNKVLRAAEAWEDDLLPFPFQNALTRPMRAKAAEIGQSDYLSLWCGQSPRLARAMSAADLMRSLAEEIAQAGPTSPSHWMAD